MAADRWSAATAYQKRLIVPGAVTGYIPLMAENRRRRRHVETREAVQRSNRPLPGLLGILLVHPEEFAHRIRKSLHLGRNPRRLLKCVDDLELALSHRGVRMKPYFAALRREAEREMAKQRAG